MEKKERTNLFPRSESHLVSQILRLLPAYLGTRGGGWGFRREIVVGRSIADVVGSKLPGKEWLKPPDVLTIAESVVVSLLRRSGPTRIDILEQLCGLRPSGLRRGALRRLQEWGIIRRQLGGRISLSSSWPGPVEIIAVEAKLSKWKKALEQAASYLRFADESYVALAQSLARKAIEARAAFKAAGVGLLVVTEGDIIEKVSATRSGNHDWRREFVYSRIANNVRESGDAA
jgi:hypothetical protein